MNTAPQNTISTTISGKSTFARTGLAGITLVLLLVIVVGMFQAAANDINGEYSGQAKSFGNIVLILHKEGNGLKGSLQYEAAYPLNLIQSKFDPDSQKFTLVFETPANAVNHGEMRRYTIINGELKDTELAVSLEENGNTQAKCTLEKNIAATVMSGFKM